MPAAREDDDTLPLQANHKSLFLHPSKEEEPASERPGRCDPPRKELRLADDLAPETTYPKLSREEAWNGLGATKRGRIP